MRLSEKEIRKRLSRLRNLEGQYVRQVKKNETLEEENKKLKLRITELETENKELRDRVEKLELIVEELHSMIFKKKKPKTKWEKVSNKKKRETNNRSSESYRRAIPSEDHVTNVVRYDVDSCNTCWWELEKLQEIIRYVEDIYLPKDWKTPLKIVTKEIIQKWCCKDCKKRTLWKEIPSQHCTLWRWVKAFVVYATTVLMLSYEQIQWFLETVVCMSISDWEIAYILKKESVRLLPEYNTRIKRLREEKVIHFDETSRSVQALGGTNYAWVMTDTEWKNRVYMLWATRWGWNLEILKWDSKLIWVSDDYWAYKNAFEFHQLCWAHPIRKMRDLYQSKKLTKDKIEICKIAYDGLRDLHNELAEIIKDRVNIGNDTIQKLLSKFDELLENVENEPEKLSNLRKSLKKNKEKYFTCLYHEGVPTTNNVAERVLRPLVIKRKLSFWSKTSDWASVMEVLYSIVFSLLGESRSNFFDRYFAL